MKLKIEEYKLSSLKNGEKKNWQNKKEEKQSIKPDYRAVPRGLIFASPKS